MENVTPSPAPGRLADRSKVTAPATDLPAAEDVVLRDFLEGPERDRSRLYEYILPVCRSTVGRMVGPSHRDAEDLLQTAIANVVQTLVTGTFARRCSLKTWAVAITRNVVKNEVRALVRDRHYLVDEDLDTYPDEEELLCSVEQGEVRSALFRLPKEMALPLLLHDLCGYTAAEVGHKLGLSSAGAQSRIWRARAQARRNMSRPDAG